MLLILLVFVFLPPILCLQTPVTPPCLNHEKSHPSKYPQQLTVWCNTLTEQITVLFYASLFSSVIHTYFWMLNCDLEFLHHSPNSSTYLFVMSSSYSHSWHTTLTNHSRISAFLHSHNLVISSCTTHSSRLVYYINMLIFIYLWKGILYHLYRLNLTSLNF